MSYTAGEALILTKLQAISGSVWTSTNTSRGNWLMLNSGASDHYAVLRMGEGTNDGLSISVAVRRYTTIIDVWQAYVDDGTSYTNILGYWEAILDQFDAYRKLGDATGTVQDARCARWDAVEEMWRSGGGPRWLRQRFYIRWDEENAVTYAE
jgi:hypothetical protein